jgi:hypothetical protein
MFKNYFYFLTFQNLSADYSMESHAKDLENYVNVARNRRRRAKALLDFERHDDDELGFRKNDIITVRFIHSLYLDYDNLPSGLCLLVKCARFRTV